jgi:hypothetical protein
MSDIEGKVAREAMSECGQRASFNAFGAVADCGLPAAAGNCFNIYRSYEQFFAGYYKNFAEL